MTYIQALEAAPELIQYTFYICCTIGLICCVILFLVCLIVGRINHATDTIVQNQAHYHSLQMRYMQQAEWDRIHV